MFKERYRVKQLEYCNRRMFGDLIVTCPSYARQMPKKLIQPVPITVQPVVQPEESLRQHLRDVEKRKTSLLVDQLLSDIHNSIQNTTDYNSTTSERSSQKYSTVLSHDLYKRDLGDLSALVLLLRNQIERVGYKLVRRLKRREALRRQQEAHCDVITCQLKKLLPKATEDMCFTVDPHSGESGFSQWVAAMKMVAQLPGGIPPEFRKRLWLTMAEKHIASRGVDWNRVERTCFSEWSHPDDGELGVQIVKDLHRTGCSLFCGEGGQENQALLKKVLLAYARWNKAVGYCQGFNMLAALILQVTDKSESDALKLMIYLIEGVLPDSYFADSLRGLSVDMAVFRELLRTKAPRLSKHLDFLQNRAKEGTTSYEPPLTNVFTMQWFLTLFCNCLPQPSVLRVWDLILLEGNEILLRTALAIWQALSDKIVRVRTADEFYCIMGILTNELLENNLIDANTLIKAVVSIGPLTELKSLREHYLYNINPWGSMPAPLEFSEKQLKLYPKEKLALDISALKKQYMKLRQRQRQAHIIFTAAISRQPPPRAPVAMNHLLLGRSAIVPAKRIGPPKGSIPPARIPISSTLQWKDASKQSSSSSSSDTELCDDNDPPSESSEETNQKSHQDELPEDNPSSIPDLMIKDNTLEDVVDSDKTDVEAIQKSDIFETAASIASPSSASKFDVKVLDVDSEDDSVDFELFLEDRVKCLKHEDKSPIEEQERVNLSRRNSERALQIIQENSVILQRILQCQSRLSISPPMTETGVETDDETLSKKSLDSCRHAGDGMFSPSCSSSEITVSHSKDCSESDKEDVTYSKYSDILEKSRNLNDKYNNLILNIASEQPDDCVVAQSQTFTDPLELIDSLGDEQQIQCDSELKCNVQPWLDTVVSCEIQPEIEDIEEKQEVIEDEQIFFSEASVALSNFTENSSKLKQTAIIVEDVEKHIEELHPRSQFMPKCQLEDLEEDKLLIDISTPPNSPFNKKSSDVWLRDEVKTSLSTDYLSKLTSYKINVDSTERRSLSATNSLEKHDKPEDKRSLSATNSIERSISPSSRSLIDRITESNEDICTTLRKTMKSPEDWTPSKSHPRCTNIDLLPTSPSPERSETLKRLSPIAKYDFKYSPSEDSKSYREPRSPFRDSTESSSSSRRTQGDRYKSSSPLDKNDIRFHRGLSPSISPNFSDKDTEYGKSSPSRRNDWNHEDTQFSSYKSMEKSDEYKIYDRPDFPRQSPFRRNDGKEEVSPKSPTKAFNPFPVTLSSRQNKEVAVKLGLYKK